MSIQECEVLVVRAACGTVPGCQQQQVITLPCFWLGSCGLLASLSFISLCVRPVLRLCFAYADAAGKARHSQQQGGAAAARE